MIRFGLCCKFLEEPIKFYTTTARFCSTLSCKERIRKISDLCLKNAVSLMQALRFCAANGIGCFRINSQILPLKTHPDCSYSINELPDKEALLKTLTAAKRFKEENNLRLTMHPDQFILLSSPKESVTQSSICEIEYQAEFGDLVGVDVINIHGGGGYGDKPAAIARIACNIKRLSESARKKLTFENDERTYTPADLLPICESLGVPFVYDIHHHRCKPDSLSIEEATIAALKTWDREPLFHISSPKDGWNGSKPQRHHDFIDPADFPEFWKNQDLTIEVEAKAKEKAVLGLMRGIR